tara:strand:+ start:418 stop:1194 length:777 start_codon:yes stop_codon:yes gene_type:complete
MFPKVENFFFTEAKNESQQLFDLSLVNKILYSKSIDATAECSAGSSAIVNMSLKIGGTVYPGCDLSQIGNINQISQCKSEFKGDITTEMTSEIANELQSQFAQQAEANTEMFATASAKNEIISKANTEIENIVEQVMSEDYSSISEAFTDAQGNQVLEIGGDCYAPINQEMNIQAQVLASAVVDVLSKSIQNSKVFNDITVEMDSKTKSSATGLASFVKALFDGLMGPLVASAVMAGLAVLALIFMMKGKGKKPNINN